MKWKEIPVEMHLIDWKSHQQFVFKKNYYRMKIQYISK